MEGWRAEGKEEGMMGMDDGERAEDIEDGGLQRSWIKG